MTDTILEALNKLVEKSGGDPSDNKLIVDAINDLVESGGTSGGGSLFPVIEITATENEGDYTYTVSKNEIPSEWYGGVIVRVFWTETEYSTEFGNLNGQRITCHTFPFGVLNASGVGSYYGGFIVGVSEYSNYDNWAVGTTVEQTQYEEHTISFDS